MAPESALRCLQEEHDATRVVVAVEAAVARDATKAAEEAKDVTGLNTAHFLTSLTQKSFFFYFSPRTEIVENFFLISIKRQLVAGRQ